MSTVPSVLRSSPQRTRSDVSLAGSSKPGNSTPDDPIKMLKILEALQKGDLNALTTLLPTYRGASAFPVASTPGGTVSSTQSFDSPPQGSQTTPVHLAVQCAQYPVIEYVLNNTPQVDLNARDHHGNTALHLASTMGRLDVVKLLLSKNDVNDGVLDARGKSALDVASTAEVKVVLKAHRTEYLSHTTTLLHQFAEQGDLTSLIGLFDHPRASFVLNISHQDTETGSTILHSASRRKDLSMVQWCLDQGIDTLLRDKKGKTAADVTKDAKIKNLLRDSRTQGTVAPLIATTPGQPPRLEGTLFKWTNYATGYKARWFVLEDGILSYFHNQEDAGNACRGSINLRIAKVWIDSNDKQRFDIIGKGSIRYHLKAGHANEAKRWILALTQSKQWIEDTANNDRASFMGSRPSIHLQANESIRSKPSEPSITRGRSTAKGGSDASRPQRSRSSSVSVDGREQNSVPHAESFVTMNNYVQTQIQMQTEMSENLIRLSRAAEVAEDSEIMKLTLATHETSIALKSSVEKLHAMTQDREEYWKRILEQESQKRELWEESMRVMSEEQLEMQRILKQTEESNRKMKKSRSVRSKASTPTLLSGAAVVAPAAVAVATTAVKTHEAVVPAPSDLTAQPPRAPSDTNVIAIQAVAARDDDDDTDLGSDAESEDEFFDAASDDDIVEFEENEPDQEEEDDEEATEKGSESHAVHSTAQTSGTSAGPYIEPSFKGYPAEPRSRLPTKQTSLRPDVSLWAILKNSIGKDLSKITLPVYFNEPTSMLQRMAEDAEYIELLDKAVRQRGATERILFVAAFAMSNYSSTIGRVAKPFNPLLGETYEYTHKEKQFRYISEQVSHHPPISACYCDSPNYNFYAEVDVKSKFWGKSFEVMPKGTSHCELKVPKAFAEGSQELLDDPNDSSKFIEHYSWKKVTTCVQNLIVGTPWIDNYGDMIITNHRTGESCLLTFKARGWRGKDAYEIRGHALDAHGKEVWEVAGRWNERLVARRAGKGGEDLGSDAVAAGAVHVTEDDHGQIGRSGSPATSHHGKSRSGAYAGSIGPKQVLLLWKRDPVPATPTPFNLTPFAMTLNDCPEELKKHLCPTDSRLRPDQRAMENAEFDAANTEKQRLEEKQRSKRKLLPPGKEFEPRWFKRNASDDGWDFVGRDLPGQPLGSGIKQAGRLGYWAERERCGATVEHPEQLKWDVEDDDIF